ncbi:acyltransferase family protein [Zavarzinella formosa]|uniref:acyltransferase family protein n=1 Tax=Zavarzinella formosa TaxID=360055 RepID=UPI0002FA96D0|nr:acyltransferase [Zavarzinella formosa]
MPDDRFDPRNNSIGFLRLALATLILYWHSVLLGHVGMEPLSAMSGEPYTLGGLGVDGFFALSGWLIAASYQRAHSFRVYLWHRCLRIFPGYWVCILLSALVLPALFHQPPNADYLIRNAIEPAGGVFRPVVNKVFSTRGEDEVPLPWGMLLGKKTIPDVFVDTYEKNMINGSLWTLAYEFRMYLLIGVLGVAGLLRRPAVVPLLILSWVWLIWSWKSGGPLTTMFPRTMAHFLMGSAFYLFQPRFRGWFALVCMLAAAGAMTLKWFPVVAPFTTTYIVFYLARVLPLQCVGKRADYSYGFYIYGYPVQQSLTAFGFNQHGFAAYFAMTLLITGLFAAASWHLVESQALKLKNWGPGRTPKPVGQPAAS